uniref:non-specific serine/threonine protein kinase n=1 Tax=Cajanus cajan TaxID=3821 RepID=A0A151SLU7_CAJCA|nr:putative LRR receptor-like serine/threonine-protein kinase At1g74360 family [Cajanus cajan]
MSRLTFLTLTNNQFTGPVPSELGKLTYLVALELAFNNFSGSIPPSLGNLTSLLWLNLANNSLTGEIPLELGNCSSLLWLNLANNKLSGKFPPELTRIGYVQLTGNQLSGDIPSEIATMVNFSMLHLGDNKFTGKFPPQMVTLPLVVLNMTRNNFSGEIPNEIGSMKCLENLDLSWNNFSGAFPISLAHLDALSRFNISYNPLISGIVPPAGHLLTFDKDSYLVEQRYLMKNTKKQAHDSGSSGSSTWYSDTVKIFHLNKTVFTHADILEATSNFTEERVIGRGGYGTVYRGMFPDGREVAVKKLQREGTEGEKEFRAEMKVLSGQGFNWPHPNLVTLYGWCLYGSQKVLVYEYIGGGSLEEVVTDTKRLTCRRRIEVAIDVARALVFLHHECYPAIVHRDVKASNVLLDKDGKAKVTDFGLARIVDVGDSHVSTVVAGTVGYVAPEYGQTWQATTKGDVYSFGVLAMELATGRRAVDGGEECLVEWTRRVMMDSERQGLAQSQSLPVLLKGSKEMGELLHVGVKCTHDAPQARPNMKEVLAMLIKIYNPVGDSNYGHLV